MYQFSGILKKTALALIVVGAIGVAFSFYSGSNITLEDAKETIKSQHDTHESAVAVTTEVSDAHNTATHNDAKTTEDATDSHDADDAHAKHVLHQLQNRPWAAFYVALFFFLGVTFLVLAFYAIQRVAQAGWSIVLFRVMEAITANLHYVSVVMLLFLVATFMHMNHLFPWMTEGTFDPTSPNYDPIVNLKSWWLNTPGWLMRSIVYLAGWNLYRFFIRKNSIAEDTAPDLKIYKKSYRVSVLFLAFFMISESMMSWDWIMGLDPHWFSTLFGWYILASLLVSAITVIAFVTIYLHGKGHLPFVNDSHLHDLTKYMFGFSVFWTYLWFSQFMLIWYADMPEEIVYFVTRQEHYNLPFLAMVVMNFVIPVLLLINSDFKRKSWIIVIGGIFILAGHYIDVFVMIMPSTVGDQWFFGIPEISALLFFIGLFIYATFSSFAKAETLAKGNPFLHESEHFHY